MGDEFLFVTLVWLSPDLPADRHELATQLSVSPAISLLPPSSLDDAAAVGGLPVGALCVATVFETELLSRLSGRPAGVGLLVLAPPQHPAAPTEAAGVRPADAFAVTASVGEVAAAIQRAAGATVAMPSPVPYETAAPAPAPAAGKLRVRLTAAGAVLAGLAIGGIVIGATEGSSTASAGTNAGGFGGPGGGANQFVPGGGFGPGGGAAAGGGGAATTTLDQELLTCLRRQGFTGSVAQLRASAGNPQLRQAFVTCIQQLRSGTGVSSQLPARP